ncbi:hypothetical protein BDP27DRAFT_1332230 [Rhodocollybia butyracea]|uniref:Uncharacterized protein n=1 Tax=Rhodocollybia butyracea TaxID=206335 RepID=A0A9P5PLB5_9AGAR|nr:hypothetical protein BDP27DRAFT_1332230 [Rhodocollybia butyracea]
MRLISTYIVLLFVLFSYAAPLVDRDSPIQGRAPKDTIVKVTFAEHDYRHIEHEAEVFKVLREDIKAVLLNVASKNLHAPNGTPVKFRWIGTPSPDTTKPIKFDVSAPNWGAYEVLMSHETPRRDFVVKNTVGRSEIVRQEGDPVKHP